MTDRQKFESIESKTKSEILDKIQLFNLDELDFIAPDVLRLNDVNFEFILDFVLCSGFV